MSPDQMSYCVQRHHGNSPLQGIQPLPFPFQVAVRFEPRSAVNIQFLMEERSQPFESAAGRRAFPPNSAIMKPPQEFDRIGQRSISLEMRVNAFKAEIGIAEIEIVGAGVTS
jgi:hypothetical protein